MSDGGGGFGGAIATAFVEVRPDSSGFRGALERDTAGVGAETGRRVGVSIGQAIAAVGIGTYLKGALAEADEAAKIAAQTEAVIRSTGGAANVTADDVGRLSERLSGLIAVDDDVIQASANLLLTFKNVRNEAGEGNAVFDRATETLQDMAAALGTDASSSAIQLGKALNDPIAGISALTRVGVTFTDQQKEQIRTMVEAGDTLGAQKIILDELASEFGGSAEAQASGLDRLTVASGNLKESLGNALAPAVEQLVPLAEGLAAGFAAIPDPLASIIVAAGGVAVVARPLNEFLGLTKTVGEGIAGLGDRMNNLGGFAGNLVNRLGGAAGLASLIGGAGTAAGIAAVLYGRYADEKHRAAESTAEFVTALQSENPEVEIANKILASIATLDAGTALREAGAEFQPFIDAVIAGDEALEVFGEGAGRNADLNLRALREGLASGEYQASLFTDTLLGLVDSGAITQEQARSIGETLRNLGGEYQGAATQVDNLEAGLRTTTAATDDNTTAVVDNTQALEDRKRAIEQMNDAMRASLPNEVALSDAMLASADALDDYRTTLGDAEATNRDRIAAGNDLIDAFIDESETARQSAEDQATAAGRAATAVDEGARAQIEALLRLAQNLEPGSPVRQALEDYIVTLDNIPEEITTKLFLDFGGGTLDLQLDDRRFVGSGRAAGGPMYRGQTYTVGEVEPETVHMGADGSAWVTPTGTGGQRGATTIVNNNIKIADPSTRRLARRISRQISWDVN